MNSTQLQRLESLMLNVINRTIVMNVNNKIAKLGRVTYVKLSSDLSILKAYVECVDHSKLNQVVNALNNISGLFRSKLAENVSTYKVPKINFYVDKTIDYAQNIDKIIKSLKNKNED